MIYISIIASLGIGIVIGFSLASSIISEAVRETITFIKRGEINGDW